MRDDQAHDLAEPIAEKVVKESEGRTTPLAFLLEMHGVCPRCFVTPFALSILRAKSWWESGQLGINYVDAPQWIHDAFSILSSECDTASKLKREITHEDKKKA